MKFLLHGVDPSLFAPWFALSDEELRARGAVRQFADSTPGYPCRVSLADADVGDELLLVPYDHHATRSPYRGSGPIYVRRNAHTKLVLDEVPEVLRKRPLALRGYDAEGMMVNAELVDGRELAAKLAALLDRREIAYAHVHYARPGCFACLALRVN